jgi:tetratricopeptide (TPR) repeat protein
MLKLSFLSTHSVRKCFLALLLLSALPAASRAADAPKKELSDKVSEELGKLKPLMDEAQKDAKGPKGDEVLAKVNALVASAEPNSFDIAYLSQLKAQLYFGKEEYTNAIPALETALKLGDAYSYFEPKIRLELVNYLSQLWAQEAGTTKVPAKQQEAYSKAYSYIRRWLDESKKPDPDKELFAASVLYGQAQLNPEKIDLGLIKQAEAEIRKGMLMAVKPKDQFYVLLLASLQQLGETEKSAEILELLVKQQPTNKNYWAQLTATYVNLQKDVRAILTIERAQAHGQMNTPKDNFTLVGIHMNIQQYDRAIELLEKGLHDGSIENELKNWEYLASCYQQVHQEQKAINTYKEAIKLYPKAGNLDLSVGNLYYSIDKQEDAYKHVEAALKKGIDKSPAQQAQAWSFLAYLAFELKKLDEAKEATEKAMKLDPNSKDAKRLHDSIVDAIKEREAYKNQKL